MTGKEILEALSFVDECYIDEAENGKIRNSIQLKKFLPMAACFCLVLGALMATYQIYRTSVHIWEPPPESAMEAPESAENDTAEVFDTAPAPESPPMHGLYDD